MSQWHAGCSFLLWRAISGTAGGQAMKLLVTDALWERLALLLPPPPKRRFRFPGRKPLDYRKILTGILFVLKTGIAWADLDRKSTRLNSSHQIISYAVFCLKKKKKKKKRTNTQ